MKRSLMMLLAVSWLLGAVATVHAQQLKARVDLIVDKESEGLTLKTVGVEGEGCAFNDALTNDKKVTAEVPVATDGWKACKVAVRAKGAGKVRLTLRGKYDKANKVWVYYDELALDGAWLGNGGFEDVDGGKLKHWFLLKKDGAGAEMINDSAIAASGEHCIRLWHDVPASQNIQVKDGQEITLSFSARGDKVEPRE